MSNSSSFSSISFEAESVIKFKRMAKNYGKTHTELLNDLIELGYEVGRAKTTGEFP